MTHGLTITESAKGARAIAAASLAVIGLVATSTSSGDAAAQAALDTEFPLDTPVLVTSVDAAAGKAGDGGTLRAALTAIGDQSSPVVIVVRVAEGEDDAETAANVIGDQDGANFTGLQALLAAETSVGFRPRILGAPGLDNPAVTAEMVTIAKKLRGMVYAAALGEDIAEAITYRGTFGARELMLIWPDTSAAVSPVGAFPGDAIARALGLRARIDEEQGWHKTLSNVVMGGVLGLSQDVFFDVLDPSTDAGVLNDKQVTTIIRRDGYRFWGNRTCAGDEQPEFGFESAVRTSHALQDVIAKVVAPFLDQPMTTGLIKDLLETGNAQFRQLAVEGRIVGARMHFDADQNSSAALAAGKAKFRIEYTPAAPLENPQVDLVITDFYYTGFADLLV